MVLAPVSVVPMLPFMLAGLLVVGLLVFVAFKAGG